MKKMKINGTKRLKIKLENKTGLKARFKISKAIYYWRGRRADIIAIHHHWCC